MKRKLWIVLVLAVLIAAVWCGTAFAEYVFTSFDRESPVVFADDDGVYKGHVSWQVNFVPTAIRIYRIDGIGAGTTTELVQDLPVTATSTILEAGNRYNLFIYYGDPDYMNERVYQQFTIAQGEPSVTVTQTVFPSIVNPDEKAAFTWSTNFTPTKIEIRNANTEALITTLPGTATGWDQFDRNIRNQIRFYHNDRHVDRTVSIRESGFEFETQPTGGNIVPESSLRVSWSTNFTPVKVEIGHKVNSGWPSYEISFVTDDTITTNLARSMSYDVPYSFPESSMYIVRAYYEDSYGSYAESAEFSITKSPRSFRTQPVGGETDPGGTLKLNWSTNFTPVKVEIGHKVNSGWPSYEISFVTDDTITTNLGRSMSYDVPYSFPESSMYTVRAYYEDSYGCYVESTEFSIMRAEWEFTVQPIGGTVAPGGSLKLSWETNFVPTLIEIGYYNNDVWSTSDYIDSGLSKSMSRSLSYNQLNEITYIRAYYASGEYIESNAIAIEKTPTQFTTQPAGGTVTPWTPLRIKWRTNFMPVRIDIGYYSNGSWISVEYWTSDLSAAGTYTLDYDHAVSSSQWYVHAFYRSNLWVTSEAFTVEKRDNWACGDNLTATLDVDTGVLTISGTGAMYNYNASTLPPWYGIRTSITEVVIEDGVTSIGEYGLYYCTKLHTVTIPASVASIGKNAFYCCNALRYVHYDGFKSQWDEVSVGTGNTLLTDHLYYLYLYGTLSGGARWQLFGISGKLEIYGGNIPAGPSLPWYDYAPYIRDIWVECGVQIIGADAFRNCAGVTQVHIDEDVTQVGARAFQDCTALTDVYYNSALATWNTINIAGGNTPLTSATVHPEPISGSLEQQITWYLYDSGLLVLTYDGMDYEEPVIEDFDQEPAPWNQYTDLIPITSVCVESGIYRIGNYAFENLRKLETVEIGDTVTSIGDYAFGYCNNLEDIVIPDSVTELGYGIFSNSGNLERVKLSANLTAIPPYCFNNCGVMGRITIPTSVTSIGAYAFANCGDLAAGGDVYYDSTSAQWAGITIGSRNEALDTANIHFTPEEVRISAGNFPDANFRAVVANFDTDNSGWLCDAEIAAVDGFSTEDIDYTTVQGMEYFTEMTSILLDGAPGLTSIDLTANTKLRYVDVEYNGLTEVNIEGLYDLIDLDVSMNALTSLDVSEFALERLICYTNPMTSLTLGNQPNLRYLSCYGTDLDILDLRGCPLLIDCVLNGTRTIAAGCVEYKIDNTHLLRVDTSTELIYPGVIPVDAAHFPDSAFRLWVSDNADRNGSGWLSQDEIDNTEAIYLNVAAFADLANVQGIEYFTGITELIVENTPNLTSIDLSANTGITSLEITRTGLTALDVSKLPLEYLECRNNALTSLTLDNQPGLKTLRCCGNPGLKVLDLRSCSYLQDAVLNGTKSFPDSGDLYEGPLGGTLHVDANTELIIPGSVKIDAEHFPDETFSDLIADNFDLNSSGWLTPAEIAAVTDICFEDHDFATVQGIETFTSLESLCIADAGSLKVIDLRANTMLSVIDLCHNGLEEINLDGLTAVEELYVYGNRLSELDVSGLPVLRNLYCNSNSLTELDLSRNTMLEKVACENNPLIRLVIGSQPDLMCLYCYGTGLTELDISGCPQLVAAYHGTKYTGSADYDRYTAGECVLYVNKGTAIHAGDPEPTFFLPAGLTGIEAEAFSGISAVAVMIPDTVTSISGNPFAGSSVQYIYGTAGSAAQDLAAAYGYIFIETDDDWLADR